MSETYLVRCLGCGWSGSDDDLDVRVLPVGVEEFCPRCGGEKIDNVSPPAKETDHDRRPVPQA